MFDLKSDKIAGYLTSGGSNTLVAGLSDSVLVVNTERKVIERWTLKPLEKKLTQSLPVSEVDGIAAGYAGDAFALLMTRSGPRFLNPLSLKVLPVEEDMRNHWWQPHPSYPIRVAASADGLTYAGWTVGLSPSGVRTLRLEGNKLVGKYAHDSAGALSPSADGSLLFTANGVYNADLKPLDRGNQERLLTIPTLHPAYYLGVNMGRFPGDREPSVSLFNTTDRSLLHTWGTLPGLGKVDPFFMGEAMPLSDRLVAAPGHRKLYVLDDSRSNFQVVPLNIEKILQDKGIDYLLVDSLPITSAIPGKPYEYAIKVLSKAGKVKFNLDSGPEGMTVTPLGVVRWAVPQKPTESKVSVIISIEDASQQTIYHSFTIVLGGKLLQL